MANTDPFSSSVIPFEVPEQMRAFAEKGVSQARDNYAKFKDAAESHNSTIEAVFRQGKGVGEGQHHGQSRLRPGAFQPEVARRGDAALDRPHPQVVRDPP